jgi:hypothetical protein
MFGKLPTGNAVQEHPTTTDASPLQAQTTFSSLVPFSQTNKKGSHQKRFPNQLFERLETQNRIHSEQQRDFLSTTAVEPTDLSLKVPLPNQLSIHIKQILCKLRVFN